MVAEGVSRTREESQAPLPASRFPRLSGSSSRVGALHASLTRGDSGPSILMAPGPLFQPGS